MIFRARNRDEKNEDAFQVENNITVQRLIISLSLKSVEKSCCPNSDKRNKEGSRSIAIETRDLEIRSDLHEFLFMLTDVRGSQMRTNKLRRDHVRVRVCVCMQKCVRVCVALYTKRNERKKKEIRRKEGKSRSNGNMYKRS